MRRRERPAVLTYRYPFLYEWDPARYTDDWLRIARDEERVVIPALLATLRARGAFAFQIDAGARALRGRAFGFARRAGLDPSAVMRGATGAADKGTPDILGLTAEGRFIAIEAKKPAVIRDGRVVSAPGRPTQAQLDFLNAVHRKNGLAGLAWGPTDVNLIWRPT